MKRIAILIITLLVGVGLAIAMDAPTDPIKVTNFGGKKVVTYPHAPHLEQGLECTQCHHTADQGKYKCGDCHGKAAQGDAPKIKDAMHKKGVGKCYDCHLKKGSVAKKKCGDCHKG